MCLQSYILHVRGEMMLFTELKKSEERVRWGLNEECDLRIVQLKCQQNSHMKVLNRQLAKEDYSLGERLFLPGTGLEFTCKEL